MAEPDDEPDYHFFGTEIEDERETRSGQHRKEVKDPSATRALPLHKQEVTDEQGRRRFHGAFTGGFSAGYFNTVGSKEGWQPSTFRSSRDSRAAVQQSVEQYLDEDELEELRRTNLQTTAEYDTFGSTAAELARRAATDAAAERPSALPALLPDELVVPVADSVGIRLLQRMGWRQGKGIGTTGDAPTAAADAAEDEAAAAEGGAAAPGPRRRWGQHASVAAENTPLHLLAPKTDLHGLGFDPFKGAEDFRRLKEARQASERPAPAGGPPSKRRRGIAFGSGALDEEDGYGLGTTLDDYVTHDDVGDYDDEVEAGGLPRSRAPKLSRTGLGDRLARQGYSFEIKDEEEDEPAALEWHPAHRQQQYALPGREAPLLLQSKEHGRGKGGLVPGFVRAAATVTLTFFPPPKVPSDYVPMHKPQPGADAALPAAVSKFAPPQADPPTDLELKQAIDSLAFFVARNGVIFENMARQRQQREGHHAFLSGGEGAAYYRWKVHSLRSIIQPQQQRNGRSGRAAIGQRSAPLTADERGAVLGEQPLAASDAAGTSALSGWATGVEGGQAAAKAAVAEGQAQQALRRQLLQVAEADRQRLQSILNRNFVAAESQEMLQPGAETAAVAGLRPGAPAPPLRPPAAPQSATAAKVITQADLARPVDRPGAGGLQLRPDQPLDHHAVHEQKRQSRLPVRTSEEWRPVPLLCKRLNVPDPYHGRPAELQMSKFRTDHLVLPETAAAVAATLTAVPAGAEDFLLPPTVAVAIKEAEAKQQQQLQGQQGHHAAPPTASGHAAPAAQQQQLHLPEDAAGAADAFLSSLGDMLGGGGGEAAAPPLPPGPGPPAGGTQQQQEQSHAAEQEVERPVDLFKAIFEDSEEEEEEEEAGEDKAAQANGAAAAPHESPTQPPQQQQHGRPPDVPQGTPATDAPRPRQAQQGQPAQQQSDDAAFGFAKLRRSVPAPPGPQLPPATAAAAAAVAAGGLDEATKQRVQEALRLLGKGKKDKRSSKKKKKHKERDKDRKEKHKGGGKEKRHKHKKGSGKEGKHKRRHGSGRSGDGSSSEDASSGSSQSDSE